MLANAWNNIILVCGNHPDGNEVIMELRESSLDRDPFYYCPRYYRDESDPMSRSCNNRFSIKEMEKLIKKINELSRDPFSPYHLDLTGYQWTEKGIDYKILLHSKQTVKISVLNRKAMSK